MVSQMSQALLERHASDMHPGDRCVDRYADGRSLTSRRSQKAEALVEFVARQYAGHTNLQVVDFGCADGAMPVLLLRSAVGAWFERVTGITLLDYNDLPEKPAFKHPRFCRLIADLEGSLDSLDLPWGTCDLVLATAFLHYLRRPETAFRHAAKLLRPGGLLAASMPHPLLLRLRRRGLGTWLRPNNRIRHFEYPNWWRAVANSCGFDELERRAIQWCGLRRTAALERLLRRHVRAGSFGANVLVVYRKR